jgi:signal transduction histidine kinase
VVTFLDDFQKRNRIYRQVFFVSPVGLVYYSQADDGRSQDSRPLPEWALSAIIAELTGAGRMPSPLVHVSAPDSLGPVQITYFTVHSNAGELLGAAGFVWDLDYVKRDRAFLDRILIHRLEANPDIFPGEFFRSPVAITLLDERGEPFYSTVPDAPPRFIARRAFSRVLPFYEVAIRLSDDRFDAWVRSVVTANLAIIAVTFLVILTAAAFALRFILHEMELSELKSTFVSNVSHELKTPLALIRLFSETLEMGRVTEPEKQKEFLRIIHKESDRLTHLINNVLDLSRIEQGKKTYQLEPVDLAAIVRETLTAYQFQLEQQGFAVESQIEENLPPVRADGAALTQAILNLMDNAIKYSGTRRYLRVELAREGAEARIAVEDHGVGIPPREQASIFEKFYRVEKGLVHDVKGSGLGLALVKHIVDGHGGRITVDSRPGQGSRFSIFLPLGETSESRGASGSRTGG